MHFQDLPPGSPWQPGHAPPTGSEGTQSSCTIRESCVRGQECGAGNIIREESCHTLRKVCAFLIAKHSFSFLKVSTLMFSVAIKKKKRPGNVSLVEVYLAHILQPGKYMRVMLESAQHLVRAIWPHHDMVEIPQAGVPAQVCLPLRKPTMPSRGAHPPDLNPNYLPKSLPPRFPTHELLRNRVQSKRRITDRSSDPQTIRQEAHWWRKERTTLPRTSPQRRLLVEGKDQPGQRSAAGPPQRRRDTLLRKLRWPHSNTAQIWGDQEAAQVLGWLLSWQQGKACARLSQPP